MPDVLDGNMVMAPFCGGVAVGEGVGVAVEVGVDVGDGEGEGDGELAGVAEGLGVGDDARGGVPPGPPAVGLVSETMGTVVAVARLFEALASV